MYYFDRDFLKEYIDLKTPIKVYVHNQWYNIADEQDLEDSEYGIGYDQFGKSETFDYREIEEISAAGKNLTIDQLQDVMAGKVDPDNAEDAGGGEESPELDLGGAGQESDLPDGGEIGGSKPGEPEEPEDENAPTDGGKRESYFSRKYIHSTLNEEKQRTKHLESLGLGQIIKNTDKSHEYYGTSGIVTDIVENSNIPGSYIYEYRVMTSTRREDFGKTVYIETDIENVKIL